MHGCNLYAQVDFIKIRKTLSAQSINQAIGLSQGNAALLVPAVIINLTLPEEEREGLERGEKGLKGLF